MAGRKRKDNPLLVAIDQQWRAQLVLHGWKQMSCREGEVSLWQNPEGQLKSEAVAFAWLERLTEGGVS